MSRKCYETRHGGEPAQLDLLAGLKARDAGIKQVSENGPAFLSWARTRAREIFLEKGQVSADDLRVAARAEGISPHHQNVWGAVFKSREWVAVGRKQSKFATNNARWIMIWAIDPEIPFSLKEPLKKKPYQE